MAPQPITHIGCHGKAAPANRLPLQRGHQRKAAPAPRAAGSADWQGMAPAAKLAFQDLGAGTSGTIDLGGDLATDYYPYTYARSVAPRLPCGPCLAGQLACAALHMSGDSQTAARGMAAAASRSARATRRRSAMQPLVRGRTLAPARRAAAQVALCGRATRSVPPRTPGSVLLGLQDTRRAPGTDAARAVAAAQGRARAL